VKIGRVFFDVLRDLRHLHRTHYENPVVVLSIDANVDEIRRISREARVQGLVLARGSEDSLLVLPRDAALGGVSIAQGLHGTLRTTGIESLRERTLEPI
jgi:DNA-binding NarL/FixJ family response regulator